MIAGLLIALAPELTISQTVYVWQGADGASWQTATNWDPVRTTPQNTDVLVFNSGKSLLVGELKTETIARMSIVSGTSIRFTAVSTANLSIAGGSGDDLIVDPGCGLTLGSQAYMTMLGGTSALLYGHLQVEENCVLSMQNSGCTATVGGIVSNRGIILGSSTGTNFISGCVYRHLQDGGSVPRGVWDASSSCEIIGVVSTVPRNILGPFGNFTWNCAGQTGILNLAGAPSKVLADFRIVSTGAGAVSFCTSTSGVMTISGKLVMDGGTFMINDGAGDAVINVGDEFQQNGGQLVMTTCDDSYPRLVVTGDFMQMDGVVEATNPGIGNGTVVLSGIDPQTIFSLGAIEGKVDLNIAKTAGDVALTTSLKLPRDLVMTSGFLLIGDQELSFKRRVQGSAASYVVTDGKGLLMRDTLGVYPVAFPVGTAMSYNPVLLVNNGDVDDIGVRVRNSLEFGAASPRYVDRQWTINERTQGGSVVDLSLTWNETDENPGFMRGEQVYIGVWDGCAWNQTPASVSGDEPRTAKISGVTMLSEFGIANDGALPVELLAFSALRANGVVMLSWRTATEANNYGFEIQRSVGDAPWASIGFVAGAGTKNSPTLYEYRDEGDVIRNSADRLRYRLKQMDRDGGIRLSPVVEITLPITDEPVLQAPYPLPSSGRGAVSFLLHAPENVRLTVSDITGREALVIIDAQELPAGIHVYAFDLTGSAPGIYMIRLATDESRYTRSFVIAR